jgi:meso-butanediol dehydrogenase/(S,S)-butanediol dehydrogenase/diacetyl reductase
MGEGRFSGKSAIVTGAASGIGKATAWRLGSEGAALVLADRDLAGAGTVAAEIGDAFGVAVYPVAFDATDPASCGRMVDRAFESLGRLDVLCNIAGVITGGPFAEISDAEWERVIAINLSSLFYITRQAMPHLVRTKGNVVNMASTAGLHGKAGRVAYSSAKAGVVGFTRSLAVEYAPMEVRVNALCPGGIGTPPVLAALKGGPPPSRLGEPADVAAAVAYLASDEARFVTGSIVEIDGGLMPING